jgi:type III restriction enzyme
MPVVSLQTHDYVPDFIIRLKTPENSNLILETKGCDPLTEVKRDKARRWVAAVNADGKYGTWAYALCRKPEEVSKAIMDAAANVGSADAEESIVI